MSPHIILGIVLTVFLVACGGGSGTAAITPSSPAASAKGGSAKFGEASFGSAQFSQ